MTQQLVSSLGLYGAIVLIAFIAGMFPLVSIEVFLIGASIVRHPSVGELALWVVLAAIGHQVAKTLCFFGGELALDRPSLRPRLDRARAKIERWAKRPIVFMVLGATIGLPPMYLLAFIAEPLLGIRFVPFTLICFVGRVGRYAVMAGAALLF